MPIRPLDMQVMVPKLQNIAQMKHIENQKVGVDQNNMVATNQKEISHKQKSVVSSGKDQEMDHEADAKDESKNKYGYKKPTNKKENQDKKQPEGKSYHKIDIKV